MTHQPRNHSTAFDAEPGGGEGARELRELWQAVLIRLIQDLVSENNGDESIRARIDAHRWFSGYSKDFREVCTLAGLDPIAVHERYKAGKIAPDLLFGCRNINGNKPKHAVAA